MKFSLYIRPCFIYYEVQGISGQNNFDNWTSTKTNLKSIFNLNRNQSPNWSLYSDLNLSLHLCSEFNFKIEVKLKFIFRLASFIEKYRVCQSRRISTLGLAPRQNNEAKWNNMKQRNKGSVAIIKGRFERKQTTHELGGLRLPKLTQLNRGFKTEHLQGHSVNVLESAPLTSDSSSLGPSSCFQLTPNPVITYACIMLWLDHRENLHVGQSWLAYDEDKDGSSAIHWLPCTAIVKMFACTRRRVHIHGYKGEDVHSNLSKSSCQFKI